MAYNKPRSQEFLTRDLAALSVGKNPKYSMWRVFPIWKMVWTELGPHPSTTAVPSHVCLSLQLHYGATPAFLIMRSRYHMYFSLPPAQGLYLLQGADCLQCLPAQWANFSQSEIQGSKRQGSLQTTSSTGSHKPPVCKSHCTVNGSFLSRAATLILRDQRG